jgi:uncharacterized protein YndB with AHSA1/START domain
MSVKKEPSGRRSVQVEVEVPGTPEEVWRAIATGSGISSWFVPAEFEERDGKPVAVKLNFGPGMESRSVITAWDPPRMFAAEGSAWTPGSPPIADEWTVEARAGGICVVRVVNSLFASTDDWDTQLDGLEQGWPAYFRILRMYLERFRGGMPCSAMQFVSFSSDSEEKAWEKAGGELGLLKVAKGQKWSAPGGFPPMTGVVDSLGQGTHSNTVLLRLHTPAPGSAYIGAFSSGGIVMVCISIYLYGDKARAAVERDEPTWQKWMGERFPMPQTG